MDATQAIAIDGDTLAIGSERIRIKGFDTPETFFAKCEAELALGNRATARMKELLKSGKVEIIPNERRDRYKRILAVIKVDGKDVAAIMIAEGLAVPYNGRGKRKDWCDQPRYNSRR